MSRKVKFYNAEICARVKGEQVSINIRYFNEKQTDTIVFVIASLMGLNPVRTCKPIWKNIYKTID